jgi:hypothetical protein
MNAELNRVLRDIAFETVRISFTPPVLEDRMEALKIVPLYWTMRLFYTHGFTALRPALSGLDKNICFINTDHESLKLSCDWCSIVNGTVETAKINLQDSPQLWPTIDSEKLKIIDRYLDFALSARKTKITRPEAAAFARAAFKMADEPQIIFSLIFLKLEQIELRWCPYKRACTYYRAKDPRYLPHDKKTIYEVGRILSEHETITCNNCPRVVNQALDWPAGRSIMDEFLQYMLARVPH